MGVFSKLLGGQGRTTNAKPAVPSTPHAPRGGSTVRINLRDPVADSKARSPGEPCAHYLVVLEGVGRGRSIQLGEEPITVGRTSRADFVLPDPRISRSHCRIHLLRDEVIVTDLDSTNGSFVDGERITGAIPFRLGGTLQLGEHVLKHKFWSRHELEEWQRLQQRDEALRWPIRIQTFGDFMVVKDGVVVEFGGKVPRKPLELLKCLIAFGGHDVSEERLSTALWPDAEGDAAHQAFATTLHRLRRLLGEGAIEQHGRKLSVNRQQCWVDASAFERGIDHAGDMIQADPRLETIFSLYRGPFLAQDEQPWVFGARERLRSKFLRNALKFGRTSEERGEFDRAIEWYRRGLEVDNVAEEFYRRLMTCYHLQNRDPEALAVYHRAHRLLAATLGTKPCPETVKLFESIRDLAP